MAFVHDFVDIALDFGAASDALVHATPDWLGSVATHGHVDLETPYRRGDAWVLPFHWRATSLQAFFPQLEAELQLAPLEPGEVRVTLSGQYRPPLGELGQVADSVVLHRVVETRVRAFLRTLDTRLRDAVSRAPAVPSPAPGE